MTSMRHTSLLTTLMGALLAGCQNTPPHQTYDAIKREVASASAAGRGTAQLVLDDVVHALDLLPHRGRQALGLGQRVAQDGQRRLQAVRQEAERFLVA